MGLIVLSIPVFFLLIGIELLVARMRGLTYYRFNDAITNLSCGIGSQVTGIFLKGVTFAGYLYLYAHSPLKDKIPNVWWVWVLLFLGVDFCYYWFHRLAHEVSVLWGSHVVHHQSEEYNLTVALRQAWFQGAFSWVFYLPLAALGFDPKMFLLLASLNTLYQFWIHTKLIGKMHPVIEFVLNTPSHHRVHHGVNPKYIDRNHAGSLIIWDRMFGTFQEEEEEVVYGITSQPKSWNPLWLNFTYWIDLGKDLKAAKGLKTKFIMLFHKPGWRPAEMGGMPELKEVSTATFKKYNAEIPVELNYYIFFQYLFLLGGTTFFLMYESKEIFSANIGLKIATVGIIFYTLISLSALFERKQGIIIAELLRVVCLVVLALFATAAHPVVIGIAAVYFFISALWLLRYRNGLAVEMAA